MPGPMQTFPAAGNFLLAARRGGFLRRVGRGAAAAARRLAGTAAGARRARRGPARAARGTASGALIATRQRPGKRQCNCRYQCCYFHVTSMVGNAIEREQGMDRAGSFTQIVLYTDGDGRAKFKEQALALREGTSQARLSAILPATGFQLRRSPVGFRSEVHCTLKPQWVFMIVGEMEIALQDGQSRRVGPGEHFFSADVLPEGARFAPKLHGHPSAQCDPEPLVALFLKV